MTRKISDGWHIAAGYDVLLEDGQIVRGLRRDRNGQQVPAYIYRRIRSDGITTWSSVNSLSYWAFCSGVRRGSIILR